MFVCGVASMYVGGDLVGNTVLRTEVCRQVLGRADSGGLLVPLPLHPRRACLSLGERFAIRQV